MGEITPAAVMPLRRRTHGRLGVAAGGGMGNIQVAVENHGTAAQAEVKQTPSSDGGMQLRVILRQAKEEIKGEIAEEIGYGGGGIARAMEYRYGLRTHTR